MKKKLDTYSYGPYDKSDKEQQWIRLTSGCPNNCKFCYAPIKSEIHPIPRIKRRIVRIMDMNLLSKKNALSIITELGNKRINGKVVYYGLICGIDYRFLTQEIANALKKYRFGSVSKRGIWSSKIKLAWDYGFEKQYVIKNAVKMLKKAGYKGSRQIMIFMICNWVTSFEDNIRKLDLMKVWNVQIADCYYDNQTFPNVDPLHWTKEELAEFRSRSRKHNHLVSYEIDPEYPKPIDD